MEKEDVLILSNRSDISTNEIVDWLDFLGVNWKRFNGEDLVVDSDLLLNLENEKFSFKLGDWECQQNEKKNIWFRRYFPDDFYNELIEALNDNESNISSNTFDELRVLYQFALNTSISNQTKKVRNVNKLDVLFKAKNIGLNIPNSIVTNSKTELEKFISINKEVIIKALSESLTINTNDFSATVYTSLVTKEEVSSLPDKFFVSLFQQKLIKKFEIRSFYFDDKFYSMAIFSQNNNKTNIDFRNYDSEIPNRTVPFQLPKNIEVKLRKLMNQLNLDTGSIDLVYTENGQIIFLEVNPVGQFGMVSYPCNYRLEEIIAKKISNYER